MIAPGAWTAVIVLGAALLLPRPGARAAVPDYKLGDVAAEDVVTPVRLQVVNPDATDELKKKVALQAPFVVRRTPQSAEDAEQDLRRSVGAARARFLAALRAAMPDRAPSLADLDSPAVKAAIQEAGSEFPKDLPIDKLGPLWTLGGSDEAVVLTLLRPLREVMAQPIVGNKTDNPVPPNQSVRLIAVKSADDLPTVQELESKGVSVSAGRVISLWRARRLVETYFPAGQEQMGRFAESFVRVNAYADPGLTAVLRDRRLEGVTVNDTYEAAQVVVRKGQTIDRRALNALAVLREKSLIGTLQTKLEQERTVAGQIAEQTKWIAGGLALLGLAVVLVFWRLRARLATALLPAMENPALPSGEQKALPAGTADEEWRSRALAAEGRAERAHAAIRSGVLGWMREKVFQTMFHQRAEMLSVQQKAEAEMHELEQRLEQLHIPLQERITAYEKRIAELEAELAAKGEENRALIGARISVVRQQLSLERERERLAAN
ncbi:MAG TPA: hypothetical protein VLT83_14970 [Opitutaceae bacterium]|nr:hypothetical protein [Opitutaceae bacterium]